MFVRIINVRRNYILMTEAEFQRQLLNELDKHETDVIDRINLLLENIPSNSKSLDLGIFPSQDGDGMFSIYASVDGPNLFVLIKSLEKYASIFAPKHTANGIIPFIPNVDRRMVDFEVNDVVVDCVAKWLLGIWQKTNKNKLQVPTYIIADEDYGTITPIEL